ARGTALSSRAARGAHARRSRRRRHGRPRASGRSAVLSRARRRGAARGLIAQLPRDCFCGVMPSKSDQNYRAWLSNQHQRRFFLQFAGSHDFTEPLTRRDLLPPEQIEAGVIGLWPEYPLNSRRTAWMVSPIFSDVDRAVSWLTKAAATWRSPFPRMVDLYACEYGSPDPHDGRILFELADRYGGYAYDEDPAAAPLSTVIFRGQRDARHGLLPSLLRPYRNSRIGWWGARQTFKAEAKKSDKFVAEFFRDSARLSHMPELGILGGPTRSALARHYGYHSQFIDFTADIGVAAFFASEDSTSDAIGSIWYLDQADLERRFTGTTIIPTPRYEHRMLFHRSVDELTRFLVDREPVMFNWGGTPEPWEDAKRFPVVEPFTKWMPPTLLEPVQLSISLYFASGPKIPRMNAQAWC